MSAPGTKRRLLTGDRPTGPLHLGHWVGTLAAGTARARVETQRTLHEVREAMHLDDFGA